MHLDWLSLRYYREDSGSQLYHSLNDFGSPYKTLPMRENSRVKARSYTTDAAARLERPATRPRENQWLSGAVMARATPISRPGAPSLVSTSRTDHPAPCRGQ